MKKEPKTAYISGKIHGQDKQTVARKFDTLAHQLSCMGYEVIKPSALKNNNEPWDSAVRSDIKKMLDCDEVHLLPDWQDSRGAQLERDIALRLGIQVIYH